MPYLLGTCGTIDGNSKLTISPGTILKSEDAILYVDGALASEGTAAAPVVFTDWNDDAVGGDTNADGNASQPTRGGLSIAFRSAFRDDENVLRHTRIAYSGGYSAAVESGSSIGGYTTLRFTGTDALVEDVTIEQAKYGVRIWGDESAPVFRRVKLFNIDNYPVYLSPFSNPTFEQSEVANVPGIGLVLIPQEISGDRTLPQRSAFGFDNITYLAEGTASMTVKQGAKLTIPAGTVVKSTSSYDNTSRFTPICVHGNLIFVEGELDVAGTAEAPVVFTILEDDRYGSPADTQGDGGDEPRDRCGFGTYVGTAPTASNETRIDHAVLAYANIPISVNETALTLENSTIERGAYNGVSVFTASPTIRNNRFERQGSGVALYGVSNATLTDNAFADLTGSRFGSDSYGGTPVRMSLVSDFSASGNAVSGTTWRGIGVVAESLVRDVTLAPRAFAGMPRAPYIVTDGYTVANNATLTIQPGTVLKFVGGSGMTVNRGLIAMGDSAANRKIVFTSIRDDFHGGDTNADSTQRAPEPGDWTGLTFSNEAIDASLALDHVTMRYGYERVRARARRRRSPMPRSSSTESESVDRIGRSDDIRTRTSSTTPSGALRPPARPPSRRQATGGDRYRADRRGQSDREGDGIGGSGAASVGFLPFVGGTLNPSLGDVSLNGTVRAFDASLILGHVVSPSLSAQQLAVADVSGEMGASAMDASLILQLIVGHIDAFPAETSGKTDPLAPWREVSVDLLVGDVIGGVGETVDVPVYLRGVSGQNLVAASLELAAHGATVLSVTPGDLAMDAAFGGDATEAGASLAFAASEARAADGTWATVRVQIDEAGAYLSPTRFVANETDLSASVTAGEQAEAPEDFGLRIDGVHPFRDVATLRYQVPTAAHVRIEVYDALGRQVARIEDREVTAGSQRVVWNAQGAAPGVYFARMTADGFTAVQQLVLAR